MQCDCNDAGEEICARCGSRAPASACQNYIHLGTSGSNSPGKTVEPPSLAELNAFQFSAKIKSKITRLYAKATNGKAKRNGPRRATIYCCIIAVCKKKGIPFDQNLLQKQLDITKKEINKVMKEIDPILGHYYVEVTMTDVLTNILKSCNMQAHCLQEMLAIYERCISLSPVLNGSKIETVAAGLAYYYLKVNLSGFDEEAYFKQARVSRDTIVLIAGEIQTCLAR